MNPEPENFESLRRLLALKRHEQPPPGYFNNFSAQVIARIKAGEQAEDSFGIGQWFWGSAWLQRLWSAIETKPALAGAFGVLVCSLLLSGVIYSDSSPKLEGMGVPMASTEPATASNDVFPPVVSTDLASSSPSSSGILPAVQTHSGSLFDEIRPQNVVWQLQGN